MFPRTVVLLFLALALAVFVARSPDSTASTATGDLLPASAGTAIAGTVKGTYHLGFSEYVQNYDATTTADLVWQDDETPAGCHCRFLVPKSGTVDWTWRYETEQCTDTNTGQIPAGTGVLLPEDQRIVLAEVAGDPDHFYFFGGGLVRASTTIDCDGGFTQGIVAFLGIPAPDGINTATPHFPSVQTAPGPLCDEPILVERTQQRLVGSCYGSYTSGEDTLEFTKYEWDLDLCPSSATSASPASHQPSTPNDLDADHIPNSVEESIGTNPLCQDTDSDGLLDPWEVEESVQGAGFDLDNNGTTEATRDEVFGPYNGQCDTSFGFRRQPEGQNCGLVKKPDPLHKDVYVEMDWQDCFLGDCPELVLPTGFNNLSIAVDPSHHAPDMAGLSDAVNVFRTAPVDNPDGQDGVNLHILVDERIRHAHNCDRGTAETRSTNFGTVQQRASPRLGVMAAKGAAFRYAWSGHSSIDDYAPGACPLPSLAEVLLSGVGQGPLPYYDISPAGFAQPRGRDILVTLAISWICQLYTNDAGSILDQRLPPCFRKLTAPGLFPAQIAQRGGGSPATLALPMHMTLGVAPSQGVRQLWGRTFMNLLGYSLGVPSGAVGNDPNARGAHPPDSYSDWEDLRYAPPRTGQSSAESEGDFVSILPDLTLAEEDGDGDGTAEGVDNCPALANSGQADTDLDGLGDGCDDDDDGDSTPDGEDDSPLDTDNDSVPNASDTDADGDGTDNPVDNCPLQPNADQANADDDEAGNACDNDSDGDGQFDALERAVGSDPLVASALPEFLGLGNSCTDTADNDGDGNTDAADDGCADADGDTVPNSLDNCPGVVSINILDDDNDGTGNVCEPVPDPHLWGDNDCDGEISSRDNQALSRKILQQNALSQTQPCPALGDLVAVSGAGNKQWGDLDCDGEISARDSQALLRRVLQQNALSQTQPCPVLGDPVTTAPAALPARLRWRS